MLGFSCDTSSTQRQEPLLMTFDPTIALAAAKTLADTIKSIRDAIPSKNSKELAPILESLLSARVVAIDVAGALSAANCRIAELEEELRNIHSFAARREQYALYELPSGQFVFREKVLGDGQKSPTNICPHCVEDEKISVLQRKSNSWTSVLHCHRCNAEFSLERE